MDVLDVAPDRLYLPFYPHALSEILDQSSFTPGSCPCFTLVFRHFVRQMLEAVAYLHNHDIAHRDINPSNFVVGSNGHLVLIDFSISVEVSSQQGESSSPLDGGECELRRSFHATAGLNPR